jgi:hypothetical protein
MIDVRGEGEPPKPPEHGVEERDAVDVGDQRAIRCAACRSAITTRASRIEVHGAHEHRRVNPSGVDFVVRCFSEAPGCLCEGRPTLFWTWFPGYAWRIASCRACSEHLGWAFSGEGTFFGLIVSRLLED